MVEKRKFKVAIEETVVDEFIIEAKDAEEAMNIAEKAYKDGEIMLTPGEVQHKQMAVISPDGAATEWIKF